MKAKSGPQSPWSLGVVEEKVEDEQVVLGFTVPRRAPLATKAPKTRKGGGVGGVQERIV